MEWEKPQVFVIDMNAEIGGYQADLADEPARTLRVTEAAEPEQASLAGPHPVSE